MGDISTLSTKPNSEKLSFKEKFFYSLGQLPGGFYGSFMGQIQAFYYAWMGLNTGLILVAQIIYGIWNLVNDPIFGVLQDRTKSKKGRYIPWIKFCTVPFSVAFLFVFFPPNLYRVGGASYQIPLFIWYLVTQMLYDTFYTIVYLAWVALAPQMTMDAKERIEISILSTITGFIGIALSSGFPLLFLTNPTTEKIENFKVVVIIFAILAILPWYLIVKYIKERQEFIPQQDTPFIESIVTVFKNPSGRIYVIYDGISVGINNVLIGGITFIFGWILALDNPYYLQNNPNWGLMNIIPLLIPVIVCFMIGIKIEFYLAKKYDVRTALQYSMACEAIGFFIAYLSLVLNTATTSTLFLLPNTLWILILGMSIVMLGFSGDFIYHNPMRADTIDYDEILTGERRESVYAGVGCFLSKPMNSVALAIVPFVLEAFGLMSNPLKEEGAPALIADQGFYRAILGVGTAVFLFPALLAVIGLVVWHWYPLNRQKLEENHAKLEIIHNKKRSERLSEDGTSKFIRS